MTRNTAAPLRTIPLPGRLSLQIAIVWLGIILAICSQSAYAATPQPKPAATQRSSAQAPAPIVPPCFSLNETQLCPAYSSIMLPVNFTVDGRRVNSSHTFDMALAGMLNSTSAKDYLNGFADGCNKWTLQYRPRFMTTIACQKAMLDSKLRECMLPGSNSSTSSSNSATTQKITLQPAPLCKSTCELYTAGWNSILSNSSICPSNGARLADKKQQLSDLCENDAFDGQSDASCISGFSNENMTCGFSLSGNVQDACTFCAKSPDDLCCKSLSSSALTCTQVKAAEAEQQTQTGNNYTLAIAFGAAGLLVAGVATYRWQRNRRRASIKTVGMGEFAAGGESNSQIYRAIYPYSPVRDDEITLTVDDIVEVHEVFSDNWAHATNLITGEQGIIPLGCTSPKRSITNSLRARWSGLTGNTPPFSSSLIDGSIARSRSSMLRHPPATLSNKQRQRQSFLTHVSSQRSLSGSVQPSEIQDDSVSPDWESLRFSSTSFDKSALPRSPQPSHHYR